MDNQTDYYLLLGDLRASTELEGERAEAVTRILREELARWSEACADDLVAGLDLNYGDEFAGLFSRPAPVYQIVDALRSALWGLSGFRFVLARGRIGSASAATSQMGGPVFVTANNALRRLKTRGRFAHFETGHPLADQALTALVEAAHTLRGEMTAYQLEVFALLKSGLPQTEIASRLGKFDQSVSDAAKRGHAELVIELDAAIEAQLEALSMERH